jgi:large subunit ribosomal protein L7e
MAARYLVNEVAAPQGVVVPESLKKKLTRNSALLKAKTEAIAEAKKANKVRRSEIKKRASKYELLYKAAERQTIQLRRQAKATGNFYVEPEARMMMIIRIKGINKLAPKPRKILKLLRLDQLHKAVFVKLNKPILNMLKYIQPYVISGYPSLKTVKQLVMKRGYAKINRERLPIQDNQIISDNLGQYGIHGMDDLIHEIYTVGPNFKQATNFLWAFKLSAPNGGFVRKKHGFHEPKGGDWGNREELINELVRRMM